MCLKVPAFRPLLGVVGMLKYLSKMAMDILPSVVATILGAYIVNHYISNKADAPPVAAAVAPATTLDRPDPARADVASLPQAGVHAKGISEKSVFEKPITAKPVEKPQEKPEEKAAEKTPERSEDKPAETASIPTDQKRLQAPAREKEKTAIRNIPLTASPAVQPATATAPSSVPANPPATIEAAVTPEERRDANANDLARAAIERLRGTHSPEAARTPEALRTAPASQPQALAPVRPLPPPIMVSTPPAEQPGPGSPAQQIYPNAARNDDPNRPTPPADIPGARPLDLQAGAAPLDPPAPRERQHTNVAEDMLTGVKSMFHAVLPQ
jgi:hypothetical protein